MPGRYVKASRYMWELMNGAIPTGMMICHHCDNPACVRPDHLFVGTAADNTHDAMQKGRLSHNTGLRGTANRLARLSEAQVLEIRGIYVPGRFGARRIAKIYGVHKETIAAILKGKSWGWLE